MDNRKQIIEIYNNISDNSLNNEEIAKIFPKLYLIMNKVDLDKVEIIRVIDVLREINKFNKINSITPEVIDLIKKTIKNEIIDLEGSLYFSIILKHTILSYQENICNQDYNLMMFLSEFEIYLELINKMLSKKDLLILNRYNHELVEIVKRYKYVEFIYKKIVKNDVILGTFISHFATMLYFNLSEYDYNYDLLMEIVCNIINNYQSFIDYCCSIGIYNNFTSFAVELSNIEKEYIVSNDMLKYLYDSKKGEKKKRK